MKLFVLAHGLVGRTDLPIPKWLFGWAAAVVLVISFAALAILWPKPELQEERGKRWFRMPGFVEPLLGLIGVAAFVVLVYSGLRGAQDAQDNLAPTIIYVHFWVGMAVVAVIFGDIFRALNPWRAIARFVAWVAGRFSKGEMPAPLEYPAKLGRWPAAAMIVIFVWVELAYVNRDDPSQLAIMAIAYAAVQLIGMSFYGIETWENRADGFQVLWTTYARLSPFHRHGRDLWVRPPLNGAPRLDVIPGTLALLVVAIGTTSFDGFSNGPVWASLGPDLSKFFGDLGFGLSARGELANSVGIIGMCSLVALFYMLGIRGMTRVGTGHTTKELAAKFAHTLIPIAFAYALAHYFSLLAYQGQALGYLISDPLGNGSNLFGTADASIDYNIVTATGVWYVQVAALVTGHVAGLMLAHDRALALYSNPREAVRSQYWMLIVMIGFTSLGLWLLSALTT
ncbi:MAG TPA: hypothetical protein VH247_07760 [Thermoleophilaceae bacterium]|jgi:hypothetical protein|nr:hypothetical protein [Thermoleophilaceae bacterium]